MLILSPFVDMRTRLQGLLRICRHGDVGEYIQNTLVPEIDPNLKVDHVARMTVAEKEILKLIPKKKKTEQAEKGQTQQEEEKKSFNELMNLNVTNLIKGEEPDLSLIHI